MSKQNLREKAISLRLKGASYKEIRDEINVSKSTLSTWLHKYPLSEDKLRELRDWSKIRIEKFRATMSRKRAEKERVSFERVSSEIGKLNRRELFVGGFFLYWGEGAKAKRGTVAVSNSDPELLKVFIYWLKLLGFSRNKLRVNVTLYDSMDIKKELDFWSRHLSVPIKNFRKPIVKTTLHRKHFLGSFTHGTCNVRVENQALYDYVIQGLKYLRDIK
ncbi:MAG: hypothetical protein AAB597_03020 [Patescibacteria group bacterium]